MPVDRNKITTFLTIIMLRCERKQPFKMQDLTKYVEVSSNAGTILRRLGLIQRGTDHGAAGHEWKFNSMGLDLPALSEKVASALDAYRSTFKKDLPAIVAENTSQLSIVPDASEDVKEKVSASDVLEATVHTSNVSEPGTPCLFVVRKRDRVIKFSNGDFVCFPNGGLVWDLVSAISDYNTNAIEGAAEAIDEALKRSDFGREIIGELSGISQKIAAIHNAVISVR